MSEAWTFARVLQVMVEKSNTGVLDVMGPDGEVKLHLDHGRIVDVETARGGSWKLGDFLVESDTVAQNDLVKADKRARKTKVPLEQVLLDRELVTDDQLKRFVELHVRETVFPLFQKTGITCQFHEGTQRANPWMSPMPIAVFLKAAGKRVEAWPTLLKRIPHEDMVFDKVEAHIAALLGGGGAPNVDGNDRVVYYHVNGKKTVRQLAYASCLGEFETYTALCKLYDGGYIDVASQHGEGEARRRRHVVLPFTLRTLAWGITAAVLGALAVIRPGALAEPEALLAGRPPEVRALLDRGRTARLERANEAYRLLTGRRAAPGELARAGLVPPEDDPEKVEP